MCFEVDTFFAFSFTFTFHCRIHLKSSVEDNVNVTTSVAIDIKQKSVEVSQSKSVSISYSEIVDEDFLKSKRICRLGPERGVCECGRCVCKENYLGDNCGSINCTIAQTDCIGVDGVLNVSFFHFLNYELH